MAGKLQRLGAATWAAMRDEYVTGNESYASLAKRYGVNLKTVQKHSLDRSRPENSGKTWAEWRLEFHRKTSEEVETKTTAISSRSLAEVREKSVSVARLALEEIGRRLVPGASGAVLMETRDLIQAAKLATSIKIELSGNPDNSAPIPIEKSLDELSIEDLRKLAGAP